MKDENLLKAINRRAFLRKAACTALGASAMSNCIRDLHLMNAALAQGAFSDYKALVCLFLAGGNDANNLIIPTIAGEYASYANIRTPVLAIPNVDGSGATAQALAPLSSDGHSYGLNPACYELAQMFNQTAGFNDLGKVAFLFNAGPLVYPMTKAQYTSNSVAKPPQLFSHADQVTQWQTSIPDQPPSTGWGGRMADLMHAAGTNPYTGTIPNHLDKLAACITLSGANTFEIGAQVQQYSVGTSGVVSLSNPNNPTSAATARLAALNSILTNETGHSNYFTSNYASALKGSLDTGAGLSTALTGTQMGTYWSTISNWSKTGTAHQIVTPNGGATKTSTLMQQFKMIAQLIEAGYRSSGSGLGMKRQIFFVSVGGYDTHTAQTNNAGSTTTNNPAVVIGSQADLLAEVSQCIWAFQKALKQMGVVYNGSASSIVNQVTTFTASDFGRTFPSNGLGSDHGWGSHHIIVGGAVDGQKTFGIWPTLAVNGPDDTSTGRWIPTTSVDQYSACLAKWLGITSGNIKTVFPNITRFGGSYAGGYVPYNGSYASLMT